MSGTNDAAQAGLSDQHKEAVEALRAGDAKKLETAIRDDIRQGMTNIARGYSSEE